jgi:hypothetical protein
MNGALSISGIASTVLNYTPPLALTHIAAAAKTALTPYALPLLTTASLTAIQLSGFFALSPLTQQDMEAIHREKGWLPQRHLIVAAIVCAYASLHFSFASPGLFSLPASALPYLRILYAYSILILTKIVMAPPAHAIHFHREIPYKVFTSLLTFTMTIREANMGLPHLKVIAAICSLPLITNILHRAFPSSTFLFKKQIQWYDNDSICCGLPLALGAATGSFSYLMLAMVHVYAMTRLQASSLHLPGFRLQRQEAVDGGWKIEPLPETDLTQLDTNKSLKWLLKQSPTNAVVMPGFRITNVKNIWNIHITSITDLCRPEAFNAFRSVLSGFPHQEISIKSDLVLCPPRGDSDVWTVTMFNDKVDPIRIATLKTLLQVIPNITVVCHQEDFSKYTPAQINELKDIIAISPNIQISIDTFLLYKESLDSKVVIAQWTGNISDLNSDDKARVPKIITAILEKFPAFRLVFNGLTVNPTFAPISTSLTAWTAEIANLDPVNRKMIDALEMVMGLPDTLILKMNNLTIATKQSTKNWSITIGDFNSREVLCSLQYLIKLRKPRSLVIEGQQIPAAKFLALPEAISLPEEWIPLALKGRLSSLSIGSGIYILDPHTSPRQAILDPFAENDLLDEIESIISAYCGVSIAEIKGTSTPKSAEDWVTLLKAFFATNRATARSRAISRTTTQLNQQLRMGGVEETVRFYIYTKDDQTVFKMIGNQGIENACINFYDWVWPFSKIVSSFEIGNFPPVPTSFIKELTTTDPRHFDEIAPMFQNSLSTAQLVPIPTAEGLSTSLKVAHQGYFVQQVPYETGLAQLANPQMKLELAPGFTVSWKQEAGYIPNKGWAYNVSMEGRSLWELGSVLNNVFNDFPLISTVNIDDFSSPAPEWYLTALQLAFLAEDTRKIKPGIAPPSLPNGWHIIPAMQSLWFRSTEIPTIQNLKAFLETHPEVAYVYVESNRFHISASILRQWPLDWDLDLNELTKTGTITKLYSRHSHFLLTCQMQPLKTVIDKQDWTLNIRNRPYNNITLYLMIKEIQAKFPLVSKVCIEDAVFGNQVVDIFRFTTPQEQATLTISPLLLLESAALRKYFQNLEPSTSSQPEALPHIDQGTLDILTQYAINPYTYEITVENVETLTQLSLKFEISSLHKRCFDFDPEGGWIIHSPTSTGTAQLSATMDSEDSEDSED